MGTVWQTLSSPIHLFCFGFHLYFGPRVRNDASNQAATGSKLQLASDFSDVSAVSLALRRRDHG